ncbi:hypothetical protein P168DRAFT_302929 [Aspergillus campestris IBT 28561]|uniref:Uncharacterized protein n=1 Tax=Aspergillus campestris (strain IBT 28561) TaxID=1392248 RepID=A0A2I1D9T4_ASPC2|nr:uncharacterized protein P168DRAFT_302929 [Aspergillus campestris IBT 28561]PKY06626.1 hypothetical protein P168DRAFT_302929 [Aspergillus campestris IBT 28561]
MPPLGTPFRRPSAYPPAGPQFASTPRFLLSQRTSGPNRGTQDSNDSIDADDVDLLSTPVATKRGRTPATRREDVIDDRDDDSEDVDDNGRRDTVSSSLPQDAGLLDEEFEALFGLTTDRSKRRRVSTPINNTETPVQSRRKPPIDTIVPSSPPSPAGSPAVEPDLYTPGPSRPTATPMKVSTPNTQPPSALRSQPRFVLSATDAHPQSSQLPPPGSRSHLQSSTPNPPRKPAFVLPRPPSPSQVDNSAAAIPTPFSPSSRILGRRGRPRDGGPTYSAGGMAAEVRSWILDMGAKRDQANMTTVSSRPAPDVHDYALAVKVMSVQQTSLTSSGPLAFVRGHPILSLSSEETQGQADSEPTKNVVLFGSPRARPTASPTEQVIRSRVPDLQPGSLIGVCRGLVWEIDLSDLGLEGAVDSASAGKWLVGMEWDLIS